MIDYTQAQVYWIHLMEHTDYYSHGYIGVSHDPQKRFRGHMTAIKKGKHKNPHLVYAIGKYGADAIMVSVIMSGEEKYCYELEKTIRPVRDVGWNIAPGGHRGPGWTKGKKKSTEAIANMKSTKEPGKIARKLARDGRRIEQINNRLKMRAQKEAVIITRKNDRENRRLSAAKHQEEVNARRAARLQNKKLVKKYTSNTFKQETISFEGRPICKTCNKNFCAINYIRAGVTHYRSKCDECGRKQKKLKPRKANWQRSRYKKKATCDLCGFHSVYPSQLTVFHIDGNLENIDLVNLRTICLNCIEIVKRKNVTWRRGDLVVD
jgi:hypothetical protein